MRKSMAALGLLAALAGGCLPEEATDPPGNTRLLAARADATAADAAAPADAADGHAPAGDGGLDGAPVDAAPPDAAIDPGQARPDTCAPAVSRRVETAGGAATVTEGALVGAGVEIPAGAWGDVVALSAGCGASLVPAGYVALGPALEVGTVGGVGPLPATPLRVTLVFSGPDRPPEVGANDLRLFWRSPRHDRIAEPPMIDPVIDLHAATVAFDSPDVGTFQLGYREGAGRPVSRRFTFRAITGVSMGAGAAAYLGTRYAREFDVVAPLGGASDWVYLLRYIRTRLLGGFCTGTDRVGTWCDLPPPDQQFELPGTGRHWPFSDSGGTFDRSEYVKLLQDVSYAYGNPFLFNPDSPYRPPGFDPADLRRASGERCAAECRGDGCPPDVAASTFTIPTGFHDGEYNADGALPVIAFCDGEDGAPPGVFDDAVPHGEPVEVLYAVDVNRNGRRDQDEPILRQTNEPYDDVGCDGTPSAGEPGYDPVTRPDPGGDDYDWYRHPLGTEGNWLWDACGGRGEPYRDVGLDGVPATSSFADGGFDYGEGNRKFDYNPNFERFLQRNPGHLFAALDEADRDRIRFWTDAGIRDVFNFATAGNHFVGRLQAAGENVRVYDDHRGVLPADQNQPVYLPVAGQRDPFAGAGRHVFVRYGNAGADAHAISEGDGAHVGTPVQALNRFMTMLDWTVNRWPGGDYTPVRPPFDREDAVVFFDSPRFGKRYRYGISLPPGYGNPANAEKRYPVLLVLHGYGQGPEDLPVTGTLLAGQMADGKWPKTIVVYPEGFCGGADVFQCNDGVDNDGDGAVDAGNDASLRVACDESTPCRGRHECRDGFCCPPGFADCGPPDPECGLSPHGRSEGGGHLPLCADGVDNDRDGHADLRDDGCIGDPTQNTEEDCRQGSFFTDHPARKDGEPGGPDYEGAMLDLLRHVDANYRTRRPETIEVPR